MKTIYKKGILLFAIFLSVFITTISIADPPPPPNGGGNPTGSGGTPVGAPIDGGLGILLAMGATYGGKKLYQARKEKKEKENNDTVTESEADLL